MRRLSTGVGVLAGAALLSNGLVVVVFVGQTLGGTTVLLVAAAYLALSLVLGYAAALAVRASLRASLRDVVALAEPDALRTASASAGLPDELRDLRDACADAIRQAERRGVERNAVGAAIAHDLKTPLIAVRRLVGRVVDEVPEGSWVGELGLVDEELQRLTAQVQQLIDVHRFARIDVDVGRRFVDLATVAQEVRAALQPLANERGVRVELSGDAATVGDPLALRRAVENLLSNAVRHARTSVHVQVFPGLMRFADDGHGLPEGLDPGRLELPSPKSTAWNPSGSGGFGWYITRAIASAHGGRLALERTGPSGTVILLYLGDARASGS